MRTIVEDLDNPGQLASRDLTTTSIFLSATKDTTFWDRASGLNTLTKPLMSLSSWIRQCDCHEAERRDGKEVHCKWAGCRASSFAARLQTARQELHDFRAQASNDRHRGIDCTTAIHMFTRALAVFDLKFSWVTEPPWLIWQVEGVT